MSLLLDIATEVHHYGGRRFPQTDWRGWCAREAPLLKGYAGSSTFTTIGRYPRRYVDANAVTVVAGQVFQALSELELRSHYIDACNGGHRRARWSEHDADGLAEIAGFEVPHYCKGGLPLGPVVGLDMDHSYWQFARHFTTQVEYRRASGTWGGAGAGWADLENLLPLKAMRSAICTASWRNRTARWGYQGVYHEVRNPYYQPQAWRLLSDYLMAWAQEVVGLFDPWAISTDCVVIEPEKAEDFLEYQLDRWGVTSHEERTWEPGQDWRWPTARHRQDNLRPISDLVRQQLAWELTGHGPMDPPMVATRASEGLVLTEGEPAPEPPPAPWQARRGLSRWALVRVELPPPRTAKPETLCRRPTASVATFSGPAVWVTGPRAPPEGTEAYDLAQRLLGEALARCGSSERS